MDKFKTTKAYYLGIIFGIIADGILVVVCTGMDMYNYIGASRIVLVAFAIMTMIYYNNKKNKNKNKGRDVK